MRNVHYQMKTQMLSAMSVLECLLQQFRLEQLQGCMDIRDYRLKSGEFDKSIASLY